MAVINEMKKQLWAIANEQQIESSVVGAILGYMIEDMKNYELPEHENVKVEYKDHSSDEDPEFKWIAIYIRNRDWSFNLNGENTASGGYL